MAKVEVVSPPAKRILAKHLAKTEAPGIKFLDMLSAFGQVCGKSAAALYEGPEQSQLKDELMEMKKEISHKAIEDMTINDKNT